MSSKIKNIIILVAIGLVLVLVYFFFIKKAPEEPALVSSNADGTIVDNSVANSNSSALTKEFLTLLLNVKSININDQIFSDPAFSSLIDSSISILNDGNEGRPNPFAPIGSDLTITPTVTNPPVVGDNLDTGGISGGSTGGTAGTGAN